MNPSFISWILVVVAGLTTCLGNLCLKQSRIVSYEHGWMDFILSPWFISSLIFYCIYVLAFAKALDVIPVSAAYPVLAGLGFSLITTFSGFLFNEHLSLNQWVGLGVILAGIVIMSTGSH
jgi:multidrug transporter EmrE-like cation transporter